MPFLGLGQARRTINILLSGPTDSGKSHFLGVAAHADPQEERPTYGTDIECITHAGHRLRFIEVGAAVAARSDFDCELVQRHKVDCVMWFIDEHDTAEQILAWRSRILRMAAFGGWIPPALCVIHSCGRPWFERRAVTADRRGWIAAKPSPERSRPVRYDDLKALIDTHGLRAMYDRLAMLQMSYSDADAPFMAFDWIVRATQPGE